ncbi:mandelate racemase/muconate lactonizing enzyme family protein [Aeoliella sp. ICT_H6.2]|uniref:Mandelate racemase/muconate lactonizing enzyme family protein n=1 Tax=Aeoliella straminimaris TaxID=2954799 RepID=A0A9X2JKQ3_9BACT|nr:mandelate racemase/muconate lactonizing enzyme family protein [Aeoliella straminimaris]MCO6047099.1 mandelate racemase/muconate lactonizing enzyme family protein [Aeoliella straminimaris]
MSLKRSTTDTHSTRPTDVRVVAVELYYLPVETRVPLKFGSETLTSVVCARAQVTVEDARGQRAIGWGETPLSVQWVWPSSLSYQQRLATIQRFCQRLAEQLVEHDAVGHPLELGHRFQQEVLEPELASEQQTAPPGAAIPLLAGLLCCSVFDVAVYDAYAKLCDASVWDVLGSAHLSSDLGCFLTAAEGEQLSFSGRYPADFLKKPADQSLTAWHLVGGLDPVVPSDLIGNEPDDGYPVLLSEWIDHDGLQALKVKLRGNDADWDYRRLIQVGQVALTHGATSLTADFNCTVTDPQYVVEVLDRLERDEPAIHEAILYIEQPFPYDLERYQLDVRPVSQRKLLLMDESAHNWQLIRLGRSLGWTGVALKTCKTLTGALLSLCWARAHDMRLMVQDLTNPMLAQIPHLQLAANCHTLLGVETNAMQFYPAASEIEAQVHPGIYCRQNGRVDLSTTNGTGFGYRVDEIARPLPDPACCFESV